MKPLWRQITLTLGVLALGSSPSSGAEKPGRQFQVSAASYAKSADGVNCSNVASRIRSILPIAPVLEQYALSNNLHSGGPPRNEFETTQQYEARVSSLQSAALGGAERVIFRRPLDDDAVVYDADTGRVTIQTIFDAVSEQPRGLPVKVFYKTLRNEERPAQNGYGAKTILTRTVSAYGNLVLMNITQLPQFRRGKFSRREHGLSFSLPTEQARLLNSRGEMIIVAKPLSPFLNYNFKRHKATFNDPTDLSFRIYNFDVEPECIIFLAGGVEAHRITVGAAPADIER